MFRRKSYWLILLCIFVYNQSFAKNIWINVVGSVEDPKLDYESFYESSSKFVQACKVRDIPLGTDCKVFSSRVSQKNPSDMAKALVEKPDKEKVISAIRNAVLNAKEGDQVVISLTNHGTVKKNGKAVESCIVLNESNGKTEYFCESDLKPILDAQTAESKKAKFFISADACMSGGFHNLGSSNVCTFAPGPKYNSTFGIRGSFLWERAAKKKGISLQELNDATSGFSSGFYDQDARVKFEMAGFRSESIRAVRCATNSKIANKKTLSSEIDSYRKRQSKAAQSEAFEVYRSYFFDNLGRKAAATRKVNTLNATVLLQNSCVASNNTISTSFQYHLADLEYIAGFLKEERISIEKICSSSELSKEELCQSRQLLSDTHVIVDKHLSAIAAVKNEYEAKLNQIIQMDELLMGQEKNDVIEEKRGQLLEQVIKLEGEINHSLKAIDTLYAESTLVLSRFHRLLDDKLCVRNMRSSDLEDNEYLRQLKIKPQEKYLDVSDKSLKEAENCEKSFLL